MLNGLAVGDRAASRRINDYIPRRVIVNGIVDDRIVDRIVDDRIVDRIVNGVVDDRIVDRIVDDRIVNDRFVNDRFVNGVVNDGSVIRIARFTAGGLIRIRRFARLISVLGGVTGRGSDDLLVVVAAGNKHRQCHSEHQNERYTKQKLVFPHNHFLRNRFCTCYVAHTRIRSIT